MILIELYLALQSECNNALPFTFTTEKLKIDQKVSIYSTFPPTNWQMNNTEYWIIPSPWIHLQVFQNEC